MDSFKTKKGRCTVTEDAIRLDSPFLSRFRRTYEGSKLLFAGVVLVFGYMGVSLIFDRFIFQRAPVVWAIAIGTIVIFLNRAYVYVSSQTLDQHIPLDAVERVILARRSRPVFVVHYERDGSAVYRAIPLPSLRYDYTEQELEKAEEIFARHGFPVQGQ